MILHNKFKFYTMKCKFSNFYNIPTLKKNNDDKNNFIVHPYLFSTSSKQAYSIKKFWISIVIAIVTF